MAARAKVDPQDVAIEIEARRLRSICRILNWLPWDEVSEGSKQEYRRDAKKNLGIKPARVRI